MREVDTNVVFSGTVKSLLRVQPLSTGDEERVYDLRSVYDVTQELSRSALMKHPPIPTSGLLRQSIIDSDRFV